MNPVETPMMQLMQAFGATSPQSVAAMFGIQDAAGDIQQDYSALFRGYLQSVENGKSSANTTGVVDLSKTDVQPFSAAPEDYSLAVSPVEQTLRPVSLAALLGGEGTFSQFDLSNAGGEAVLPEDIAAFSLAVDYRAAPLELTPENLQALQAALPQAFAGLQSGDQLNQTSGASSIATVASQSGHILPAKDLLFLFGENTQIPETLKGGAAGLTLGGPLGTPQPTDNGGDASALLAQTNSAIPGGTMETAESVDAGLAARQALTTPQTATPPANAETTLAKETSFNRAPENITSDNQSASKLADAASDEQAEADGQVLTVVQKKANVAKAGVQFAAAQTQTNSQPANAAAVAQAAKSPSVTDGKRSSDPEKPSTVREAALSVSTASPSTPVVTAPQRQSVDWVSPWTTPERAAGWPESFSAGLISGGLNGLSGHSNALGGMGLMGGRPDPMLGQQVAKQLNINITRAVKAGDNQFSMRMDPPELGRVTVKLTFAQNGLVKSQVIAERPETLELLQREVRGLERAVEAGGHKTEPGAISFSLDSGGEESAGRSFAEAMQEDRLKEQQSREAGTEQDGDALADEVVEEVDLEEILAHVTPETGLDVRV